MKKTKADNYQDLKEIMLSNFQTFGATMKIKVHYLFSHLERFPQNLSEEQGERFHQDVKTMEERHQERLDGHMMSDYRKTILRVCARQSHNGKSYKRTFYAMD